MGEIDNLKIEIINLKQLLVGYQECMQKCTFFQNMALSFQLQLKTCQGELRTSQTQLQAAQVSAKAFESKYNAALEVAGTKLSNSTTETETTKKRKRGALQQPAASAADKSDTGESQTTTREHLQPAEKKTEEQSRIMAQTEKKQPVAAALPAQTFEERFAQLEFFQAGHGHCNVPRKDFKELSYWVKRIRQQYAERQRGFHNGLTDERIEKLESIGFQWRIRTIALVPFETRLVELKKFKQETGHCNVPRKYTTLGEWVHHIRGEHRRKGELEKARRFHWTIWALYSNRREREHPLKNAWNSVPTGGDVTVI